MFIAIKKHRTAAAARSVLNALSKAAPFKLETLLADNVGRLIPGSVDVS